MPLLIPPGYLQAVYRLALPTDPEEMVTTLGHQILDTVTPFEDMPDVLRALFGTHVMPNIDSTYSLVGVDIYVGQDGGGTEVFVSTGAAVAGGTAGTALPQNCAALYRKRTNLAGNRGRGRMYLPGVPAAQVFENGSVNGTYVAQVQVDLDAWVAALIADDFPPVVLHRSEAAGVEPAPTAIVSIVCDAAIATQRRRLRP